jgi:hypothetical protein
VQHQVVTDEGVLRVGPDGVLEFFRDLDGRSNSRILVWGCEAAVEGHDGDRRVTLTVTRKRLPVVRVRVPADQRTAAEAVVEQIRGLSAGDG